MGTFSLASRALGRASIKEASQVQVFLEPELVDTDAHNENVLSEAGDIINILIHAEIDQLHDDLSMASPSASKFTRSSKTQIPFSTSFLYLLPVQFRNAIVQPRVVIVALPPVHVKCGSTDYGS